MTKLYQPSFWAKNYKTSWLKRMKVCALLPASFLYGLGYKLHHYYVRPRRYEDMFILCVGNITAGGSGKTPTVLHLYDALKDFSPIVLSKGYGGAITRPYIVSREDSAHHVGDEALLIAQRGLNVIISQNREQGIAFAAAQGHKFIIMDDGLQNPHISADYNICVLDSGFGFGNEKLLPAGPLREPITSALKPVQAIISIGSKHDISLPNTPLYKGKFIINAPSMNKNIYAFAAIGRPEKFYESLKSLGMSVLGTKDFPDHYDYSDADINAILAQAKKLNAVAVTTEKDAVKIDMAHYDITVVKGDLSLQNSDKLVQDISSALRKKLNLTP